MSFQVTVFQMQKVLFLDLMLYGKSFFNAFQKGLK